jgi:succinate dehydrogenase / fumarate reductase cytochrome b subunit
MSGIQKTIASSIGAKTLMALTGLGLVGFVIAHMLGNLQVFAGPEKLNAYAKTLQDLGPGLWVARLGLLALFGLHVATAFRLVQANKAARPTPYVKKVDACTTYAARTMWVSGLIVLAFVLYHLAHFTVRVTGEGFDGPDYLLEGGGHDVYAMVVDGFSVWWVAAIYIVANILLGLHISHGASSAFSGTSRSRCPSSSASSGRERDHAARRQDPERSHPGQVGQAPTGDEAREPRQQAEVHGDRGGDRARRRIGRGLDGGARLRRRVLLLPGQPAPRALDRRAGRHQRREELPQRRRQHLAALLRHRQGR